MALRQQGNLGNLFLYFLVVALLFGITSLYFGGRHHNIVDNRIGKEQSQLLHNFKQPQSLTGAIPVPSKKQDKSSGPSRLAGLSCQVYGGPPDEFAQEMVYWHDIPSDSQFVSPLKVEEGTQYLTFEPDAGGWNNIRMAMETVFALAVAMGRTLVLPPEKEMYLLGKNTGKHGKQQNKFSFNHFFHTEAIHEEHVGLDIITMKEFLETVAMQGHLVDRKTGIKTYPPGKITEWDGRQDIKRLFEWLREATLMPLWTPENCIGVFPSSSDPAALEELKTMGETVKKLKPKWETYKGNPVPVDAPPIERLKENWAERSDVCVYDKSMQQAPVVHFAVDHGLKLRLLVHFYAFVWFQNWKHDLWLKRFIRDHVRYMDEIQCAAARVVHAVRKRSGGVFDAFHVRRGDFQYKATRVKAEVLLEMAQRKVPDNTTLYISTDERNKSFFDPLKKHYDVVFLDDFHDEALIGINTNYYGMIDQLVATRSRTFFGCWFSTFTGYINRLRGYHSVGTPDFEKGTLNTTWYYVLQDRFDHMQEYYPIKKSFFAREFPTSWRLIDTTLETD